MNTIKLYHISYNLSEPLKKFFIPKTYTNSVTGEDEVTKHICLSDSIEGCINAAEDKLGYIDDGDEKTIIIWEKEFFLYDKNLKDWRYLYENGLVPDAALTHEYWYLKNLYMEGSKYRIKNINNAINNRHTEYIINPKYRNEILSAFINNGVKISDIQHLDLCTLINHWLPTNPPQKKDILCTELRRIMTVIENESEIENENTISIFDTPPKTTTCLDVLPQHIYSNMEIEKIN